MVAQRKTTNHRSSRSRSENIKTAAASMAVPQRSNINYRPFLFLIPVPAVLLFVLLLSTSSNWSSDFGVSNGGSPSVYSIEVVNEFPHDPRAFTQGLLYFENDTLYESTGLYGQSSVRKVALRTGKVEVQKKMDGLLFGEGLTLLGDKLFQVTWLKNVGFVYDRNNLSNFEQFNHEMKDGWGLATDGKILLGSDGSSTLYHIDPQTYKATRKHTVKYKGNEVHNLNELEYINGEVWANIYTTDCIARISPTDGNVLSWILLHKLREGLLSSGRRGFDVLNGIAWDAEGKRLFVTGKLWPKLYEIKLHPVEETINERSIIEVCMRDPFNFRNP